MKSLSFILLAVLAAACTHSFYMVDPETPHLTCVSLVDNEGLTESVRTQDRLKKYEGVDFLKAQPYQKILRVFNRDAHGNARSILTLYHPNGLPKQYLEALNNQASGTYREWFPNGVLKVEATIIGGSPEINTAAEKTWLFDGLASAWDEDGHLAAEIQYVKGELSGQTTHYHSNGQIWKEIPYVNNRVNGTYNIYLENGDLLQKSDYQHSVKHGPAIRYWGDGSIASEEDYEQGRLINGFYYAANGDLVAKIENGDGIRATFGKDSISELQEYKDGLLDGKVQVFARSGQLVRLYHMKDNLNHGEEMHYYPPKSDKLQAFPKLSISWYQGKVQGVVKSWYDNGVMESQREMSENNKNGLATAWYRDGQLMMIEEYDQGKLKRGDYYQRSEKLPISQVTNGKGLVTLHDSEGNFLRKLNYESGKPEQ